MNPYQLARQAIDAAHAGDPRHEPDGSPAEMIYADRIEGWVSRLVPGAGPLLLLAARCQHLERWSVLGRDSLSPPVVCRISLAAAPVAPTAARPSERAGCSSAPGLPRPRRMRPPAGCQKPGSKPTRGTQALEDAACLVFLESTKSVPSPPNIPIIRAGKFIEISPPKTWRKMSPIARDFALGLKLPPTISDLVKEAVRN